MLMEQAQNEAKKISSKKINSNIILLALTSDISPQSKLLLEKHGITYQKLFDFQDLQLFYKHPSL